MNYIAGIGAALSEEKRIRLVTLLRGCSLCVKCLTLAMDSIQPTVSRHLGVLRHAGLVKSRSKGASRYYSLDYGGDHGSMKKKLIAAYCFGVEKMEPCKSDLKRLMCISLTCDADCVIRKNHGKRKKRER